MDMLIVCVTNEIRPRFLKHCNALKQLGINPVSICFSSKKDVSFRAVNVKAVQTFDDLLSILRKLKPSIIHISAVWNNEWAAVLMRSIKAKFVYETYDLLLGVVDPNKVDTHLANHINYETMCLSLAHTVVFRDFRFYNSRTYLFKNNVNYSLIYDGVGNSDKITDAYITPSKKSKRIVYVGNSMEFTEPNHMFLRIARLLLNYNMELHIFPLYTKIKKSFERFKILNPQHVVNNLHIHEPTNYDLLQIELQKYDAGLDLLSYDGGRINNKDTFYKDTDQFLAGKNKIFDYLEAGLVILTHKNYFNQYILKKVEGCHILNSANEIPQKVSIPFNREQIPHELTAYNSAQELHRIYASL